MHVLSVIVACLSKEKQSSFQDSLLYIALNGTPISTKHGIYSSSSRGVYPTLKIYPLNPEEIWQNYGWIFT